MNIDVEVTADDIRDGEPYNPESCPIALALKRSLPEVEYVSVGQEDGIILLGDDKIVASRRVRNWIEDFDTDWRVNPFILRLTDDGRACIKPGRRGT